MVCFLLTTHLAAQCKICSARMLKCCMACAGCHMPWLLSAGNMGTWYDTSAIVTSVRNFPNDRGFVVGVLKSFLGLSSSLYTSIYAW